MKKKLYLIGILFLLITALVIKETYSLFETDASGEATYAIGKWAIKLNNRDISFDKIITLDDFTFENSEHTEDGYFAPGSKAEFEIDIDVSDSDVSVEYEIDIDNSVLENYPNIRFKIIDLDTEEEMISNKTNGVITLTDEVKTKKLKIVLEWINDIEYDENDTSLIGKTLSFNAKVNFKQYLGE